MAQTKINLDRQAEGQVVTLGTTSASGEALLTLNKGTAAASTVVLDAKGSANIAGDLNLTGNLNITGAINETSVTSLSVTDLTITTNKGGSNPTNDTAGLKVEGVSSTTLAALFYNSASASKWTIGNGTTQADVVDVSSTQTLTNKTIGGGQISGNIAGNAANVTGTVAVGNGGTGAITLTGYVKGNGTSAMTASSSIPGSDVSGNISGNAANVTGTVAVGNGGTGATSITGLVKGNGTSAMSAATSGSDYAPGTAGLSTGILKSTTSTGALSIAVAADFPILNQNTTGTASNVTGTVAVANGGTGKATISTGALLVGNGTSAPTELTGTTSGHVVTWNGSTFVVQAPSGSSAYHHAVTVSGTQDSANKTFTISSAVSSGSEQVFLNGMLLDPGSSNDYVISGTTITFQAAITAPAATDKIRVYGVF